MDHAVRICKQKWNRTKRLNLLDTGHEYKVNFQDCMYDYCAMPGDTENICSAAAAYAQACAEAGHPVEGTILFPCYKALIQYFQCADQKANYIFHYKCQHQAGELTVSVRWNVPMVSCLTRAARDVMLLVPIPALQTVKILVLRAATVHQVTMVHDYTGLLSPW